MLYIVLFYERDNDLFLLLVTGNRFIQVAGLYMSKFIGFLG